MNKKKNNKRVNIRKIAELCDVSIATVSRAINHPEKVAPELYERIQAVIKEYNYVPNELAKQLFAQDSRSLAIFVQNIENPFYTNFISYLNEYAFDSGYTLIICDTKNDEQRELKYVRYLFGIKASGMILMDGEWSHPLSEALKSMPCVAIDRIMKPSITGIPTVASDYKTASAEAIDYLVSLGHKRIAFAGLCGSQSALTRFLSYKAHLSAHGLSVPEAYIGRYDAMDMKVGEQSFEQFFSQAQPPTAIMCVNDLIAYGVLHKAEQMGVKVPEQVSVIGTDGILVDMFKPRLATLQQDVEQLVKAAVKELEQIMESGAEDGRELIVPMRFIKGETIAKASDSL
ncbi:MAG: LacI family DNA-binding transcriptional regulator [Christensenellales bacterium]